MSITHTRTQAPPCTLCVALRLDVRARSNRDAPAVLRAHSSSSHARCMCHVWLPTQDVRLKPTPHSNWCRNAKKGRVVMTMTAELTSSVRSTASPSRPRPDASLRFGAVVRIQGTHKGSLTSGMHYHEYLPPMLPPPSQHRGCKEEERKNVAPAPRVNGRARLPPLGRCKITVVSQKYKYSYNRSSSSRVQK